MKKTLLIATILAGAYGASAQGLISFNNSSSAGTKISVNSAVGGPATGLTAGVANGYYYELFYSTTSTTVEGASGAVIPSSVLGSETSEFVVGDSNWTDGQASAASSATPGRVLGSSSQVVTGVGLGNTANIVVIGWSANIGSTISALEAFLANPSATEQGTQTFVGESAVGVGVTLGNGGSIGTPAAFGATGVPGFTLGEVPVQSPEPTTIALGVIGAASVLAFRRKKA